MGAIIYKIFINIEWIIYKQALHSLDSVTNELPTSENDTDRTWLHAQMF